MSSVDSYRSYDPYALGRQLATTLAEHMRDVEDCSKRNFQMGALLQAAGRFSYNHGGNGFDWPVQYRNHTVEGNTGMTRRVYTQLNPYKHASLGYRGYQATDQIFVREVEANKTEQGIIKVFGGLMERIQASLNEVLGKQYYLNGDLARNSMYWQGLETLFDCDSGGTGQTLNNSTGATRSANAADYVGFPTGSYAGITTTLGNYGGENSTGDIWPNGVADPEYDFWTPLVVCWDSTSFSGSSHTFKDQGEEALRYGLIHAQRNSSMDSQLTNVFLGRSLYQSFMNYQSSKEEIRVESSYSLRALGFKNVFMFDGIEVSWEAAVPSNFGYGINYGNIEVRSMFSDLLRSEGPTYNQDTQSWDAVVSTLSNIKFKSPRNFVKWCQDTDLAIA